MGHFPDFDTFCRLAAGVHLVPVYRRLLSDMLTPVTACRRIDAGRARAFSKASSAASASAVTASSPPAPSSSSPPAATK